jgi:hypothetical protein
MFAKKSVRVVIATLALALVGAVGVHPTTSSVSHKEAGIRWNGIVQNPQ